MFGRKGQNIAEYAILISLVIAAAIAMQTYVKRGLQGRVHNAVDHVGSGGEVAGATFQFPGGDQGTQYEPYYIDSNSKQTSDKTVQEGIGKSGVIDRNNLAEESRVTSGSYEKFTTPEAQ